MSASRIWLESSRIKAWPATIAHNRPRVCKTMELLDGRGVSCYLRELIRRMRMYALGRWRRRIWVRRGKDEDQVWIGCQLKIISFIL